MQECKYEERNAIQGIKKYFILSAILIANIAYGQSDKDSNNTSIGLEIDALPYITGGYYGSAWVSHNHFRYRGIITKVTTPDFALEDGFTNNELMVYAVIADYFFKPGVEKWWVGTGLEYWKGQIQTDAKLSTANYQITVFTAGGGYVWKFFKNFYLNPWGAVHLRIAGDEKVIVDGKEFIPPLLTPEVSVKIGWYFSVNK